MTHIRFAGLLGGVVVLLGLVGAGVLPGAGRSRPDGEAAASEAFRQATSTAAERVAAYLQGLAEPPRPLARASAAPAAVLSGTNVLVNNPALDVPDSTTQSEVSLAMRGSTICAGYNDSGAGGFSGLSRSGDLGQTWTDQGGIGQFGDPVLAVHQASGRFYYAELAVIGGVSAIGVAASVDDCHTFAAPVDAGPSASAAAYLQDKPWIAVDNTAGPQDGTVYACWTRFVNAFPGPPTSGEIRFSRSVDGGQTFGDETVLSPVSDYFPFGCHVAVGPNGEVYAAWSDRGSGFAVRFRRSLDGGLSWQAPVQVNSLEVRHPGMDRVVPCEPGSLRPTLNGDIRMLAQVWMAVDTTDGPYRGTLYAVWAHDPPGSPDHSDVYYSRSTDGGVTWAQEIEIPGVAGTDQFEPFVAVATDGAAAFAWYERGGDPDLNLDIELYSAVSRDGGESLDWWYIVSDVSFPVPPLTGQSTTSGQFDPGVKSCYMGEYIAVAGDSASFYYAWGDNRNTVTSPAYPAGRPDPDVFFDLRPAPGVVPCPAGWSNFDGDGFPAGDGPGLGNGKGVPGDDATVAGADGVVDDLDPDDDNDGIPDAEDGDPCGDNTYDDNADGNPCPPLGTDIEDDGPSWDVDCDGVLDGFEGVCPGPAGDTDGDGLRDGWETCKWGTRPDSTDSDGDGIGDCREAADVNGDTALDFVGDTIYYAKAALAPTASFGKDGDFDINGDGIVDFVGDVIQEAKFALILGLCT